MAGVCSKARYDVLEKVLVGAFGRSQIGMDGDTKQTEDLENYLPTEVRWNATPFSFVVSRMMCLRKKFTGK